VKSIVTSFAAGVLFALGLGVSGMTKPSKVVGFLDLFGAWDASLAFVMVAAVGVYFLAHRLITRRAGPLFDTRFYLPVRQTLDRRLLFGAAVFGVGWGLGGYCPGPGLVAAASGVMPAVVFVISMAAGMKLEQLLSRQLAMARERSVAL
jgi:uncharacterized membrane protein YedE/YeeE